MRTCQGRPYGTICAVLQSMTKASETAAIMRIVMRYQSGQQQWWSGRHWVGDPSDAEEYSGKAEARRAFRRVVLICNLGHDDRTVVVADYGLVSERVVHSVNVDGKIVVGDWQ